MFVFCFSENWFSWLYNMHLTATLNRLRVDILNNSVIDDTKLWRSYRNPKLKKNLRKITKFFESIWYSHENTLRLG